MKFLRHFQTKVEPETPAAEWQLSEEGRKRSEEFIENNEFNVETVYTSTEPKAVQTAEKIAEKAGAEIVKIDLLREVDRSEEGFVEDHDRYIELVEDYLSGGLEADWESQEKVKQRFQEFLDEAEENSLAVTHGLFLSLNIPEKNHVEFWKKLSFGEYIEEIHFRE
jgi:broad specificity phosphatase PhoE